MSNPAILKQVYRPDDRSEQVSDKAGRLIGALKRPFAVEVVVRRYQKKRSPEANSYLWGVVYPLLADASGYEKEELHFIMCGKFFGTRVIEIMGDRFERPIRTTTTNEEGEQEWLAPGPFAEFVDFVIREAALWYDLSIPPPQIKEPK